MIGKVNKDKWREFKILPSEIEKDSLWVTQNIETKKNQRAQKAFVKGIEGNKVKVVYSYQVDGEEAASLITYQVRKATGAVEMEEVEREN